MWTGLSGEFFKAGSFIFLKIDPRSFDRTVLFAESFDDSDAFGGGFSVASKLFEQLRTGVQAIDQTRRFLNGIAVLVVRESFIVAMRSAWLHQTCQTVGFSSTARFQWARAVTASPLP